MYFIRLLYKLDRKLGDHIVGDLLHGAVVSVPQRPEPQLDRPHGHQSLRVVPNTADIVIRYYLLSTSSLLLSIIRNSWFYLQFRRLALKSPHLGPSGVDGQKKLGCASDPPVCSLLLWENRMRTLVFSWGGLQGQLAKLYILLHVYLSI